ncbi:hypothetical protein [Pseudomonas rhodesiae]|uniref:hypothetical protein n=1 Tax=Pseudomonas rhodesiae TaxID=76760 RepID=UPI000A623137|nr:hypothetical protein [Pseudomonas rhodesiae]
MPVLVQSKRNGRALAQPFCVLGTGSTEHRRVYLRQAYKGLHEAQIDFQQARAIPG